MAKSATTIELEIRTALNLCRVCARGLWFEFRRLVEHSQENEGGRPGHLERNRAGLSLDTLALECGCNGSRLPDLLRQLQIVKLVDQTADGTFYSPPLARLYQIRNRRATKMRIRRKGNVTPAKVSHDTHKGVTNQSCDTPPPDGFSLSHSLSSLTPLDNNRGEREIVGLIDDPDDPRVAEADRIGRAQGFARCWITAECPGFLRKSHVESFARLVVRLGKPVAIRRVQEIRAADPLIRNPFAYLEQIVDNERLEKQIAKPVRPASTSANFVEDR